MLNCKPDATKVAAIKNFWELPAEVRPLPAECLLLSTHEPCPMCISAMTWSAFPVRAYVACEVCPLTVYPLVGMYQFPHVALR